MNQLAIGSERTWRVRYAKALHLHAPRTQPKSPTFELSQPLPCLEEHIQATLHFYNSCPPFPALGTKQTSCTFHLSSPRRNRHSQEQATLTHTALSAVSNMLSISVDKSPDSARSALTSCPCCRLSSVRKSSSALTPSPYPPPALGIQIQQRGNRADLNFQNVQVKYRRVNEVMYVIRCGMTPWVLLGVGIQRLPI